MAVIVVANVPGQTQEGFATIAGVVEGVLKQAPGFILTTGFLAAEGWQTIEVWETAQDAARFFAEFIRPNLPPGLNPKRAIYELHTLITP